MLDSIPVLAALRAKLGYDSQRQRLIAQNVANADTPGYAPKDLGAFSFGAAMAAQGREGLAPLRTQAAHLAGRAPAGGGWRPQDAADSEARLDGGQVVLEDQMQKMTAARTDYEAALTLYSQSMSLLRIAAKAPGK